MEYINIGKIVTTHGIKGELKIISNFDYKTEAFKIGNKVYLGKDKNEEVIQSYRVHKNYDMVTFNGYDNINQVLKYKNNNVFINKEDLKIDGYLDSDYIGLVVYVNDKMIGRIRNIIKIPNNSLFEIEDSEKVFYIPNNSDLIEKIDMKNKKIFIKYIEGLI